MSKYYNAVKVKLTDENQIYWLNYVREIFLSEYELLKTNPSVQLKSFTGHELSHAFRGHFVKKLAELTNKNYNEWELNNHFRYFKMFSMHLRQDFNSLNYKQKIVDILEQYNFDLKKSNKEIREELVKLNLYPTKQEATLMNIIRSKNNNNSFSLLQNYYQNGFSIPLDFTLGQDKQTILHPDEKQPVFHINLNGNWIWFDFRDNIKFQYIQNRINSDKFVRFCKPKFILDENENWYCILVIQSDNKENNEKNSLASQLSQIAGVDIGQIKPYSAVIVNKDETNLKASLASKELTASKETKLINSKLERVKEHLFSIYNKINVYKNIIKNNKNQEFTNQIIQKLEERNKEKDALRRKRKELQKRKSYLVARDLMRQLNFFNVKKVNIERLNWVEHTGGSWDFSQQQDVLEQKAIEHGIKVTKVYAANTSKENPFTKKRSLGKDDAKTRMVQFSSKKYQIDRDILGAINIALRDKNNQFRLKYNEKKLKTMINDTYVKKYDNS